jgi:hypothetical protein
MSASLLPLNSLSQYENLTPFLDTHSLTHSAKCIDFDHIAMHGFDANLFPTNAALAAASTSDQRIISNIEPYTLHERSRLPIGTLGTTGTALRLYNGLNGAQRLNDLNGLNKIRLNIEP